MRIEEKEKFVAIFGQSFKCFLCLWPILLLGITGCSVLTSVPEATSTKARLSTLAAFPQMPLQKKVTVYWNTHMVPFIDAEVDADAAFMLGVIQAHLRLTQLELAKRIAQGRISEMVGPFANDIDVALRALNLGKASSEILRKMPFDSREWLHNFVSGINFYKAHLPDIPHGMKVLNISEEAWTAEDTLAIGRLSGVDVNWLAALDLLPLMETEQWPELWQRIRRSQRLQRESFSTDLPQILENIQKTPQKQMPKFAVLQQLVGAFARSGSNSVALSGWKTHSGGAMIANDPHLGFTVPNLWILAGLKSPSYHMVGMIPVGLPVFGFGRTPYLAWGGTNMRQSASDYIDVSLKQSELQTHTPKIQTRFWVDAIGEYRSHPRYGPVISDLKVLNLSKDKPIALRWSGHLPSDEITAMLGMAKAQNWQQFKHATQGFSVPGQNYIFVTAQGNIGQVLATWLPKRSKKYPDSLLTLPAESDRTWQDILTSKTLPFSLDPSRGVIASANNKPVAQAPTQIGWFFPIDDRIQRLYQLLGSSEKITLEHLKRLQKDSFSLSHKTLYDFLDLENFRNTDTEKGYLLQQQLQGWDGYFRISSRQAYLYHLLYLKITDILYQGDAPIIAVDMKVFRGNGMLPQFVVQDLETLTHETRNKILQKALKDLQIVAMDGKVWGDIHQIHVQHILGNIPILGQAYHHGKIPVDGHTATVFKTAGNLTNDPQTVTYGSQARHISDMSDPNKNYFILYGGQDGQINSENALDQLPLWHQGRYIQVPLAISAVRNSFEYQQQF